MKSRFFHNPPDPRAYKAGTVWTEDGWKVHGVLFLLMKLDVINIQTCIPDEL